MKGSAKRLICLVLVAFCAVLVAVMLVERGAVPANGVLLQESASQMGADSLLSFDLANNGAVPITCPDSWYLEFEDGSTTNLSLAPSGDVRVAPGSTGTITFPKPETTRPWRLGASYYEEDVVFDVKVQVDQSSFKTHLPLSASRVRGKIVFSDWIN